MNLFPMLLGLNILAGVLNLYIGYKMDDNFHKVLGYAAAAMSVVLLLKGEI